MNRIYLLPHMLIVTLILTIATKETNPWMIALYFLIGFVVAGLIFIFNIYLKGRYYVYRERIGKPVTSDKYFHVIHQYIRFVNRLLRMDIEVEGLEKLDPNQNYFITPNHQSNADILVCLEIFERPLLFVSKFSMSQVIIVKDYMHLMDCTFLKKDDMRGQIEMMKGVQQKLQQGKTVILFPEGHRSFKNELDGFKNGAFKMPLKTQVPIVPVTLTDVFLVGKNFPFKRTKVKAYVHDPISYDVFKDMNTTEISEMVQEVICTKF